MIRGSEALQLLKSLLKPTVLILLWMTLLRLLLYAAVFYSRIENATDVPAAFWAGFRFDLLVMGFFWIPIVIGIWLSALVMAPRKLLFLWKLYFVVAVLLIFDFSWLDFFWTAIASKRLNHEFFSVDSKQILDQGWGIVGSAKSWIATLGMGFSSLGLVLFIYDLKIKKTYSLLPAWKLGVSVLVSVLAVAFAARGTWTPHHLNIEHAQISGNPFLNQLPLNPLWNLDK